MSILEFPRLHFQGFARIHAPTGHKNGLVDLSTNTVYKDGKPLEPSYPLSDYQEYLQNLGPRFNERGEWDEAGAFSMAKGWDFGGNGHFAIEAKIIGTQTEPERVDLDDPVVGRSIDMWGHHNEYLGTTFNRARIFDVDPASNWTAAIMVGQLTFGRQGGSQEVPNLFSAPVEGLQPPRWQNFDYIRDLPEHCLNDEFKRATVYQFTVSKEARDLFWGEEAALSPAVARFRQAMEREDVLGLVVQFSLSDMSAPLQPDSPTFWDLHGTIGLWCEGEMSTYPSGRLLIPPRDRHGTAGERTLSNLSVRVSPQGVSLNAIVAVPCIGRAPVAGPGPTHAIGPKGDFGDWELRTANTRQLVARIPRQAYQLENHRRTSGIIDVPLATSWETIGEAIEGEALCLIGTMPDGRRDVLLAEKEIDLQIDDACLFIEFPDIERGEDGAVEVEVRSFVRGRPAPVASVYLRQFYNPRAFPGLRSRFEADPENAGRSFEFPRNNDFNVLEFKPGKRTAAGEFASTCALTTDGEGRGRFTIRGHHPGTARVLLSADPLEVPGDSARPNSAELDYDNDDRLGFWPVVGSFAARVMTDDRHLEEIPASDIDFELIYREIFAYYELCFSFMKAEVFSLADKCKVQTYARLTWQMCDPGNKNKTYYMPPTRDLSRPKAMLLYKYLNNQQRLGYVPEPALPKRVQRTIGNRAELATALRQAAELEVAVMLQYIYAAYSIPNYVTGQEYVRRGLWTPEQLKIACGDGQEVRDYGMRGLLLRISQEEMMHFLLVNNILMAIGEPFYPANPDFGTINENFPLEVDLALEPFNATSIQRFIRLETPDFLENDLVATEEYDSPQTDRLHGYGSLSELYRQIREAIENIPDLFIVKKGTTGGEHHLFLREDFNHHHPDYQLQVDDVKSALFAIDLITEQGEGCNARSPKFDRSHYQQFRACASALAEQQLADSNKKLPVSWNPAYPALRNPTLHYRDHNTNVVTVPETRTVMQICDESYALMMQLMVQHFGLAPKGSLRRSKLMNSAIDVMTGIVRPLGELLMTMPSGKRGRTAGPSFSITEPLTYLPDPETAYRIIASRFATLSDRARQCEAVPPNVTGMLEFLANFFERFQ